MQKNYTPSELALLRRIVEHTCVVRLPLATAPGECYVSLYGPGHGGYPKMKVDGKHRRVHRVAYEILVGPIPDGLEPDHICRIRSCWRIEHVEPVTHLENMRRAVPFWTPKAPKTHCPQGHEYTPENTYRYARNSSHKHCRTCVRAAQLQYRRDRGIPPGRAARRGLDADYVHVDLPRRET